MELNQNHPNASGETSQRVDGVSTIDAAYHMSSPCSHPPKVLNDIRDGMLTDLVMELTEPQEIDGVIELIKRYNYLEGLQQGIVHFYLPPPLLRQSSELCTSDQLVSFASELQRQSEHIIEAARDINALQSLLEFVKRNSDYDAGVWKV